MYMPDFNGIRRIFSNYWFHAIETFGEFNIEAECPKIVAWAKRCLQKETVAKTLPDQKKVYEYVEQIRKRFGNG
uniref:Glutathione S-transferase n=1 Tax=Quercus lobata TaxID=97700 RepID=A0A7N2LH28_QUELO